MKRIMRRRILKSKDCGARQVAPPHNPIEAIKFRMEQQALSRKYLEGSVGTRGRIAEVLSGKRELSISMMRRLPKELGIPEHILIG
jgi:HTH-type transcriptional regulator / antitoxin HigA